MINSNELLNIIACGETSEVQFKQQLDNVNSFAAEMIAMANTKGGIIIIGVSDKVGEIIGLDYQTIQNYSNKIANIANELINPLIFIHTEVVLLGDGMDSKKILIVHIEEGINKPYKDKNGTIWTKQGADKRKVTDNAEIMRFFQKSGNLLADEMEVFNTSLDDVNESAFRQYFTLEFNQSIEDMGFSFEQALKSKRVLRNNQLTLAGLLFFGKAPQSIKPAFTIKFVSYFGNDSAGNHYRSKPSDLTGTIPELFQKALEHLKANLLHIQDGQSFNSIGILEVSEIALIEILQNALLHRDYFKNAPIRVLVFDNRIEIISPGTLPNSLTVEDIKYGNPVIRNNQLVSFGSRLMPFSGLGSGIKRAIKEQANLELINDITGEQFIVIIPRPTKA